MFSCFCWSFLPVVYLLYPETTQRTLEDMDEIFRRGNGAKGGVLVFDRPDLTRRRRPQAFVDAERRKIDESGVQTELVEQRPGLPAAEPGVLLTD